MGILEGRVAIVTGASSGIGRGAARRFAEEGAVVVACSRRIENLEELAREIEASGGKCLPLACDVAEEADIDRVVETTIATYGRVDILANIAQGGMDDHTYLVDVTIQRAVNSYLTGPVQSMLFMQKCFPHMKQRGYGRIINCSSAASDTGIAGFAAYNMAKAATTALTRSASQEWGVFGIVVNTFLPVIWTEAFDKSEQGIASAKNLAQQIPVGRFGMPYEDCSPLLAFMASEGAGYLNGEAIRIDGGMYY